jgi:hypothetical protein
MAERGKAPAGRPGLVLACRVFAAVLGCGDAAPAHAYRVIGAGLDSCGSWTTERREPPVRPAGTRPHEQWVLGFLAGIAEASDEPIDPMKGLDAGVVRAWVDNYCQAHPLEPIIETARAFYRAHPH